MKMKKIAAHIAPSYNEFKEPREYLMFVNSPNAEDGENVIDVFNENTNERVARIPITDSLPWSTSGASDRDWYAIHDIHLVREGNELRAVPISGDIDFPFTSLVLPTRSLTYAARAIDQ